MTREEQLQFFDLLKRWDIEEMDCQGNCEECYYCMNSPQYPLDNCPLLVTYDMVYRKIYETERWNKRKG